MKLKNSAFTNNVSVWTPSINDYRSNPDWGMEVGQSEKHTFIEKGIEKILTAMVYYKIQDESEVMVGLGKGGKLQHYNDYDDKEFVLTSLFPKVYLNGNKLKNQKLLLYITKDLRRKNNKGEINSHFERRLLKFSKNLTYHGQKVNQNCIDAISNVYGQDSSWAILKMDILNEDELHLYGIKISDGERKYKNKDIRNEEFDKLWKIQHPNESIDSDDGDIDKKKNKNTKQSPFSPTQIIYYGVPGSGKSHQIQEDLKKKGITEENHQQKRVVFHPDYCNADFVGQIVPVTKRDGGIRYQFKAGPFTKILRDAYENPDKEYALIIEEINRGNAAAIFGDLFQLLDRKKENDPIETVNGNSYGPGWSDYCIENDYINAYFRGAYDTEDVPNPLPPKTLGNITFNDNVDIRLPPNFSIYATMNTSDQNVYTLDNAFQRRWEMKQISDELKNTGDTAAQYSRTIKKVKKTERGEESVDTNVQWGDFRKAINDVIMDPAQTNGLSSMDDKRLGGWFYTESDNFAEKVLKYLWDDAFKFDRPNQFDGVATLEKLVEKFNGDDGFNVFKDERISKLQKDSSTTPGDSAQKDNANLNG